MTTTLLEQPISLIKQGNMLEAQRILEEILTADPQNLTAWSWYVKTYPAGEKRIKALKLCLQYNPENEQVKQALEKLEENTGLLPAAKPIKIRYFYIHAILLLVVEVAIFILSGKIFSMGIISMITSWILTLLLILIMFITVLLIPVQVLVIGAIAPIHMLYKSLSQPPHKNQLRQQNKTYQDLAFIWFNIKNLPQYKNRQWAVIFSIIGTGSLTSIIFCFSFLLLDPNNQRLVMAGDWTYIVAYIVIFGFLVGANFAALIIKIFDWVSGTIKVIRDESQQPDTHHVILP